MRCEGIRTAPVLLALMAATVGWQRDGLATDVGAAAAGQASLSSRARRASQPPHIWGLQMFTLFCGGP